MKNNLIKLVALMLVASTVASAAPVYARRGVSSETATSTESESETTSATSEVRTTAATDLATRRAEVEQEIKDRRAEVEAEAEKAVEGVKKHTAEERKNRCEARKTKIASRVTKLQSRAAATKTKLDGFLDRVTTYLTSKNLVTTEVQAKIDAANDAKTKAEATVTALSALSPTIDCTTPGVSSSVAELKAAADQAKADLKAYKEAIHAVFTTAETTKEDGANQ